eukprot:SAG11_NODE_12560_length_697_cov_0.914716_1_plen_86_part_00
MGKSFVWKNPIKIGVENRDFMIIIPPNFPRSFTDYATKVDHEFSILHVSKRVCMTKFVFLNRYRTLVRVPVHDIVNLICTCTEYL